MNDEQIPLNSTLVLDDAVALLKEGAADYLAKPVQTNKLYERVEEIFTNLTTVSGYEY